MWFVQGICKSLTDTWMWKLGPSNFQKSNTEIGFSLQCGIPLSNVYVRTGYFDNKGPGLGCPQKEEKKFWVQLKQTETRSLSVVFRFVSWNQKRTYIETSRTVSNQTETNETTTNFLKLFRMVFCLFWFNRNIKTCCFGIKFETTKTKFFKTNRNNTKFYKKNTFISSLSNCFGWSSVCFGSIETWKLSVSV